MNRSLVAAIFLLTGLSTAISLSSEVFAVPISDNVIQGQVVLPDGQTARFAVREGSMLTVLNEESDYWYGFVPEVRDDGRQVRFTPFEITSNVDSEHIEQVLDLGVESAIGEVSDFDSSVGAFSLVVRRVERWKFKKVDQLGAKPAQPNELQKIFGMAGGGLCCVSCGAITVCGGSVSMSCGSCSGGRPSM